MALSGNLKAVVLIVKPPPKTICMAANGGSLQMGTPVLLTVFREGPLI